jgi:hypothetical protein
VTAELFALSWVYYIAVSRGAVCTERKHQLSCLCWGEFATVYQPSCLYWNKAAAKLFTVYWDDFNTIKQLSCLSRKRAKAKMFAWEEANQCNSQVIWTERKWQPCCLRLSVLNTVLQLSCLDSWSVWAEMSYLQCTSQAVFPERSTSQAVCDETGLLQHTSWAVFTGKSASRAVWAEMSLLQRTSRALFTERMHQLSCLRWDDFTTAY